MKLGIAVCILQGFYYNPFQCSLWSLTIKGTHRQLLLEVTCPFSPQSMWDAEAVKVLTFLCKLPCAFSPQGRVGRQHSYCTFRQLAGFVSVYWSYLFTPVGTWAPCTSVPIGSMLSSGCYTIPVTQPIHKAKTKCRNIAGPLLVSLCLDLLYSTSWVPFHYFQFKNKQTNTSGLWHLSSTVWEYCLF